jgi:hypothetical protein
VERSNCARVGVENKPKINAMMRQRTKVLFVIAENEFGKGGGGWGDIQGERKDLCFLSLILAAKMGNNIIVEG